MGESGSGKTTLSKMLPELRDETGMTIIFICGSQVRIRSERAMTWISRHSYLS